MTLIEFILAWRELAPVVKGKCFYCGRQTSKDGKPSRPLFMTRDHVIPHSVKGRATHGNRVICCRKCNSTKGDSTLQEFKERSKIETFYAETILGVRIDDLSDIAEVTLHILTFRKTPKRSIKCDGRPEPSATDQSTFDCLAKDAGC